MAMLADRTRKRKMVLNPVSKPLWNSNAVGDYGKKMLEKMGWSVGKGLGAGEQGIQEPLRATYKSDNGGIGFKGDGNPFLNQDEFNSLLTSLSGEATVTQENLNDAHTFESLEEKSKNCRTRVHYKKFTRGKDLSRYSGIDLACIVGNGKKVEEPEEIDSFQQSQPGEMENSFGVTTINSGSIADYFKMKLGSRQASADLDHTQIKETSVFDTALFIENNCQNKRKQKSGIEDTGEEEKERNNVEESSSTFIQETETGRREKKKEKQRNEVDKNVKSESYNNLEDNVEPTKDFEVTRNKEKRKKKRKNEVVDSENESLPNDRSEPSNKLNDNVETNKDFEGTDNKDKGKKRKKQKNEVEVNVDSTFNELVDAENRSLPDARSEPFSSLDDNIESNKGTEETGYKKKKKRKSKVNVDSTFNEPVDDENDTNPEPRCESCNSNHVESGTCFKETKSKDKKKKRKNEVEVNADLTFKGAEDDENQRLTETRNESLNKLNDNVESSTGFKEAKSKDKKKKKRKNEVEINADPTFYENDNFNESKNETFSSLNDNIESLTDFKGTKIKDKKRKKWKHEEVNADLTLIAVVEDESQDHLTEPKSKPTNSMDENVESSTNFKKTKNRKKTQIDPSEENVNELEYSKLPKKRKSEKHSEDLENIMPEKKKKRRKEYNEEVASDEKGDSEEVKKIKKKRKSEDQVMEVLNDTRELVTESKKRSKERYKKEILVDDQIGEVSEIASKFPGSTLNLLPGYGAKLKT